MDADKAQEGADEIGRDMAEKTPEEAMRAERIAAAAERALAEAAARRDGAAQEEAAAEIGGRDGPNPTRFGDWEKKGVAVDF